MPLTLCVLLWAHAGRETHLGEYEDAVLALLPAHGGTVVSRVRNTEANESATEVQVIEFVDDAALENFMADPARLALAPLRDQTVARTEIIRVTQL
jgi:uncharacterized protein (DUF1330 family)